MKIRALLIDFDGVLVDSTRAYTKATNVAMKSFNSANVAHTNVKDISIEIARRLDLGISRDDMEKNLDTLVGLCYQSPICTAGPRSPSMEDWKNLFRYPFDGKDVDF